MKMKYYLIISLLILTACSSKITYPTSTLEEFISDSIPIANGIVDLPYEDEDCINLSSSTAVSSLMDEYSDAIMEGDVLKIVIYHSKRHDYIQLVDFFNSKIGFIVTNGAIQLPQMPPCEVAGLTLVEAKTKIEMACSEEIDGIEIFISFRSRSERMVEIIGSENASAIAVDGKMRLYEVLALAKIPPHVNLYKSYVERDGQQLPVNLYKLIQEGDMNENIVMEGKDKIYLADSSQSTVMMMGELGNPRLVDVPKGCISIFEALSIAGGISFTGNKDCIQVIRGSWDPPKIYVLSWKTLRYVPNKNLLLIPGDVVYVSAKPITDWNRFISQSNIQLFFSLLSKHHALGLWPFTPL